MLPKIKLASAPPEPVSFGAPGTPSGRDPWTHTPVPRASGQRPEPPRPCRGQVLVSASGSERFHYGVQSPGGASGVWSPESLLSGRAPTPGSPQTSSSSLRTRPLVPCRRLPAPLEIGRSSKIQAYFLDLDMMKF